MTRIIAFDLGKNLAWAWRYQGNNSLAVGHIELDGIRPARFAQMMKLLPTLISHGCFDLVAYETPFARGYHATRALWGAAAIVEACAETASVAVLDVSVATIKKFATNNGRASKEEMIAAAQRLGYKGDNEHEADAVCLLHYTEANVERG